MVLGGGGEFRPKQGNKLPRGAGLSALLQTPVTVTRVIGPRRLPATCRMAGDLG